MKDGYCTTHHPTDGQDMAELGRRGGSTPKMTAIRRAAAEQDDSLREQARLTLSRAMAGEDVPKAALDAARSLFSYGATRAPAEDKERSDIAPREVGLLSVARVLVGLGALTSDQLRSLAAELEQPPGLARATPAAGASSHVPVRADPSRYDRIGEEVTGTSETGPEPGP